MTEERCPRWTDADSDASPLLRELVRRERADVPSEDLLRALAARLAGSTAPAAPGGVAGGGTGPGSGAIGSGTTRVLIGAAISVLGGVAVWLGVSWSSQRGRAEQRLPAHEITATVSAPISAAPAPAPVAIAAQPASIDSHASPGAHSRAKAPGAAVVKPVKRPTGSLQDELELLRQARLALAAQPLKALDAVARHEADFSEGVFVEEREAIAIEALVRTQRRAQAERRARVFSQKYPGSAYSRRIASVLATAP